MDDLCWLKGGPADGRVLELTPTPTIIVPVTRELADLKAGERGERLYRHERYLWVGEDEDGQLYEWAESS